jgi:6,7-dimethyl-8-ribityllumazine synthase
MATAISVVPNIDVTQLQNNESIRVGIATAQWNIDITGPMKEGALGIFKSAGILDHNILSMDVPGSYELPLAAKWLADSGCDAVVCIGCLIKGDTPHFEFISESVAHGLMNLNLSTGKPIIFAVITTLTHQQAIDRSGGILGNKGAEGAEAAIQMMILKQQLG